MAAKRARFSSVRRVFGKILKRGGGNRGGIRGGDDRPPLRRLGVRHRPADGSVRWRVPHRALGSTGDGDFNYLAGVLVDNVKDFCNVFTQGQACVHPVMLPRQDS